MNGICEPRSSTGSAAGSAKRLNSGCGRPAQARRDRGHRRAGGHRRRPRIRRSRRKSRSVRQRAEPCPVISSSAYAATPPRRSPGTSLNGRYTFETLVRRLEPIRARRCAGGLGGTGTGVNPLFIWGESGLGKTHLLHAAGNYAQRLFRGMRVKYARPEEFTNDLINRCATTARSRSRAATATSTSCWSTTSSSSRAKKVSRKSFSIPSTRCATRTSRSSSV